MGFLSLLWYGLCSKNVMTLHITGNDAGQRGTVYMLIAVKRCALSTRLHKSLGRTRKRHHTLVIGLGLGERGNYVAWTPHLPSTRREREGERERG